MAEMIVVICPTVQRQKGAAHWHDGQNAGVCHAHFVVPTPDLNVSAILEAMNGQAGRCTPHAEARVGPATIGASPRHRARPIDTADAAFALMQPQIGSYQASFIATHPADDLPFFRPLPAAPSAVTVVQIATWDLDGRCACAAAFG
jgi:hypothetical protein